MKAESKTLGLIVARGGSKGIPRKNLALLGGRPLVAWSVEAGLASEDLDLVAVSSDDPEIADVAREYGVDHIIERPPQLATDEAPTMPVVFHALETLPAFDMVVLLQPTSPLRSPRDIDACIELSRRQGGVGVVSVTRADPSPYHMVRVGSGGRLRPFADRLPIAGCRQDLPEVSVLNGAVYVASVDWLERAGRFVTAETLAYEMPKERSIDIDDDVDLQIAEALLAGRRMVARRVA